MQDGKAIRVLLADDTVIALEGWKSIIETADGIDVIGEASNPLQTLRLVRELVPDVLLIDLRWGMDTTAGTTAIAEIKRKQPEVKVIAVTAYEDLIADARRAGADIAILKMFSRDELLSAIRELAVSEEGFPAPETAASPLDVLSPREREVLALLVDGLNTQQIADRLVVSTNTIRNHISRILSKLGVNSRLQAVKLAHEHNLDS